MSNVLGTSFATSGFAYDPNLSPNNQSFSSAVLAVVRRAGLGTGGTGGGGTGSVTSVAGTSVGTGSSALVITGSPITTSGTFTFALSVFDGTHAGVVPSSLGGTLNFLRADGSFSAPGGGGTGSVTGVDAVMAGAGTSCGTWSNEHITTAGTATLTLNAFNGTLAGLVPSSPGGTSSYLRADGAFAAPPGGLGGATVTVFLETAGATQTWTPQTGSVFCRVICIGGGGGGGAGCQGTGTAGAGGGGGGAGGWSQGDYIVSALGTARVVTFSSNSTATGGTAALSPNAGAGQAGPSAAFGSELIKAYGGTGGNAGSSNSGGAGQAGGLGLNQTGSSGGGGGFTAAGNNGSDLNVTSDTVTDYAPTGGGGGGAGNSNASRVGGRGGQDNSNLQGFCNVMVGGAPGGTTTLTVNGGTGNNYGVTLASGGGGGGCPASGAAGNGGRGGDYGAGGGGGGGSPNGFTSGAGGGGGHAAVVVIEWGSAIFGLAPGNPSVNASTTATNGILTSYMRSDAAPAIDQGMSPTWTGAHSFFPTANNIALQVRSASTNTAVLMLFQLTGTLTATAAPAVYTYPIIQFGTDAVIQAASGVQTIRLGANIYYNGTNWTALSTGAGGLVFVDSTPQLTYYTMGPTAANGTATNFAQVFVVSGTAGTGFVVQAWGPTAARLVDMTPDTGSFTGTMTGMTTAVTASCVWSRNGNQVMMRITPTAFGTSNSTSWSMGQVPAELTPASAQIMPIASDFIESGGALVTSAAVEISGTTITFINGGSASGWGATLAKGFISTLTISWMLN